VSSDPAVNAILDQAHRELAKLRDIDARILAYRQLAQECVTAGSFLVGERARIRRDVAELREAASEIRREERTIAKGWMR
jgi:hypothetical protein